MSRRVKNSSDEDSQENPGGPVAFDRSTSGISNDEYIYEENDYNDDEDEDELGSYDYNEVSGACLSPERTTSYSEHSIKAAGTSSSPASSSGGGTTSAVLDGSFRIADYGDIESIMTALVTDVSTLLNITEDVCIVLLCHFKWNKERLVDGYYADPDLLLETIGASSMTSIEVTAISSDDRPPFSCPICGDEGDAHDAISLGCQHQFCGICYGAYLSGKVEEGPSCVKTFCPMFKCKLIVPSSIFIRCTDKSTSQKYRYYMTRNFIETNKSFRWCPSAGCEKVVIAGPGITTIPCSCGNPFCFKCGEEAHDPVCCPYLAEWSQKCSNESETANWILANTKKCTQCNARIEKNQGCNHMVCKICKYEFCWICMGSWIEHSQSTGGFYKCNRFEAAATDGTDAQKAKVELDRYLHYYQRYIAHDRSSKFASANREAAERRMLGIQEAGKSAWIDVQFLKQAVEQVVECRRVLKFTYVLGYFLKDHTQEKHLFEHHQEMLEKHTEILHHYTEMSVESIDRTQVVNLTRVAEKFMGSLLTSLLNSPDYTFKPVSSR